jgi:hypothetical protein
MVHFLDTVRRPIFIYNYVALVPMFWTRGLALSIGCN